MYCLYMGCAAVSGSNALWSFGRLIGVFKSFTGLNVKEFVSPCQSLNSNTALSSTRDILAQVPLGIKHK